MLEAMAENATDLAADYWSEDHGGIPVPLATIVTARIELIEQTLDMLRDRAEATADAHRDAQMAGDEDANGNFIPHDRYQEA
jgi:hypothetical protein